MNTELIQGNLETISRMLYSYDHGAAIQVDEIRKHVAAALAELSKPPELMTAEIDLEAVARTWWKNEDGRKASPGVIDMITSEDGRIKVLASFAEFITRLIPDTKNAIRDHATRYGHCTGCKTGGTHYLGSIEHPDPDEHLPDDQYLAKKQERFALNPQTDEDGSDEDPAPVLVAFSEGQIEGRYLKCHISDTEIAREEQGFEDIVIETGYGDARKTKENGWNAATLIIHANTRAVSAKAKGSTELPPCDVCGSTDVIEVPHMGKNCNRCHPLVTTNER